MKLMVSSVARLRQQQKLLRAKKPEASVSELRLEQRALRKNVSKGRLRAEERAKSLRLKATKVLQDINSGKITSISQIPNDVKQFIDVQQVKTFIAQRKAEQAAIRKSQLKQQAYDTLRKQLQRNFRDNPGFVSSSRARRVREAFEKAGLSGAEGERLFRENADKGTLLLRDKKGNFIGGVNISSGKVTFGETYKEKNVIPTTGTYSFDTGEVSYTVPVIKQSQSERSGKDILREIIFKERGEIQFGEDVIKDKLRNRIIMGNISGTTDITSAPSAPKVEPNSFISSVGTFPFESQDLTTNITGTTRQIPPPSGKATINIFGIKKSQVVEFGERVPVNLGTLTGEELINVKISNILTSNIKSMSDEEIRKAAERPSETGIVGMSTLEGESFTFTPTEKQINLAMIEYLGKSILVDDFTERNRKQAESKEFDIVGARVIGAAIESPAKFLLNLGSVDPTVDIDKKINFAEKIPYKIPFLGVTIKEARETPVVSFEGFVAESLGTGVATLPGFGIIPKPSIAAASIEAKITQAQLDDLAKTKFATSSISFRGNDKIIKVLESGTREGNLGGKQEFVSGAFVGKVGKETRALQFTKVDTLLEEVNIFWDVPISRGALLIEEKTPELLLLEKTPSPKVFKDITTGEETIGLGVSKIDEFMGVKLKPDSKISIIDKASKGVLASGRTTDSISKIDELIKLDKAVVSNIKTAELGTGKITSEGTQIFIDFTKADEEGGKIINLFKSSGKKTKLKFEAPTITNVPSAASKVKVPNIVKTTKEGNLIIKQESQFAGTGLYERTEEGTSLLGRTRLLEGVGLGIGGTSINVGVGELELEKEDSRFGFRGTTRTVSPTKESEADKTVVTQLSGQRTNQKLKQESKLKGESSFSTTTTRTDLEITRTTRTPRFRIPFGLPSLTKKTKSKAGKQEPYDVYIKKKKIADNLEMNRARDFGAYVVDNSIAAQFRMVKSSGKINKPPIQTPKDYFAKNQNKFRNFMYRKGKAIQMKNKYIEKKNKRLDSSGEISQITAARFIAARRKKALNLTKSIGKII